MTTPATRRPLDPSRWAAQPVPRSEPTASYPSHIDMNEARLQAMEGTRKYDGGAANSKSHAGKPMWVSTGRKVSIKVDGVMCERVVYRNSESGKLCVRKMGRDKKTGKTKASYIRI
jgi:hypothetical protein